MRKRNWSISTLHVFCAAWLIAAFTCATHAQDFPFPLPEPEPVPTEPEPELEEPVDDPEEETVRETENKIPTDVDIPVTGLPPEADAAYKEGKKRFDEENYAEAIDHFSFAISAYPRFFPAYYDRGRAFAKLEYYDLALSSFSKAAYYGRSYPQVFNERGLVYYETEKYREAIDDFTKAVELRPTNAEYLYNLGRAYIRLGSEGRAIASSEAGENFQKGINFLDRAIDAEEADESAEYRADIYFERGFAQAEVGQADKAIKDLEAAVEFDADNSKYQERLGYAHLQRGEPENLMKAINAFGSIIEKGPPPEDEEPDEDTPDLRSIFVARAVAILNMANETEGAERTAGLRAAVKDCEITLSMEPRQPVALLNHGIALRMLGEDQKALRSLSEALRLSPGYGEAHFRRGIMWYHAGEYDLALEDFRDATEGDPRPLFWIGLIEAKRENYEGAIEYYTKALRLNRGYIVATRNRALAFMRNGQYERAVRDLNNIIRADRTDASAYYQRGVAYEWLGDTEQAIDSYKKAVRWDPELAAAKSRLDSLE